MKNPFDAKTQEEQHVFFHQMTEAINEWLLNKYPLFDTNLQKKMDSIEYGYKNIDRKISEFQKSIEESKVNQLQYFKDEINKFLSKEHPGVASRLFNLSDNLEKLAKRLQKNDENVEKKLKKITDSQSLCEDVYKMRDEMKTMQKEWNTFSEKLKKVFK